MYEDLLIKLLLWALVIFGGPKIFAGTLARYQGVKRFIVLVIADFFLIFLASYAFSAAYWAIWEPVAFFSLPVSPILIVGDWPADYIFFPVFMLLAWIADNLARKKGAAVSVSKRKVRVGSFLFLFLSSWLLGFIAPNFPIFNYRISNAELLQPSLAKPPILHKMEATLYGLSNPSVRRDLLVVGAVDELVSSVQYNWRQRRWFAFYVTQGFAAKRFFCRSYFDSDGNFYLTESGCARYGR